jgi:ribose-phosphate pyrophosphokinase
MEVFVEIQENVRGEDMFVIQSTSFPANDNLMELLIMIDALKRASAKRITAVIPYFGYARQDRKPGPRTPISAKLVANLITEAGASRLLTVDLHAGQIQGFFDIPTDNLYSQPVMVKDIQDYLDGEHLMVVSPDVGGVVRARALAKAGRDSPSSTNAASARRIEVMNIIGDVSIAPVCWSMTSWIGRHHLQRRRSAVGEGRQAVYAYATHGVLSGGAVARIRDSVKSLVVTDSIAATEDIRKCPTSGGFPSRLCWAKRSTASPTEIGVEPVRLTEKPYFAPATGRKS